MNSQQVTYLNTFGHVFVYFLSFVSCIRTINILCIRVHFTTFMIPIVSSTCANRAQIFFSLFESGPGSDIPIGRRSEFYMTRSNSASSSTSNWEMIWCYRVLLSPDHLAAMANQRPTEIAGCINVIRERLEGAGGRQTMTHGSRSRCFALRTINVLTILLGKGGQLAHGHI